MPWWIYVLSTEEQAADTQISCLAAIREHLCLGKPRPSGEVLVLQLAEQCIGRVTATMHSLAAQETMHVTLCQTRSACPESTLQPMS